MTTIKDYRSLPADVQERIAVIEEFIGDMENADLADGSAVYAEDVAVALNAVIDALSNQKTANE